MADPHRHDPRPRIISLPNWVRWSSKFLDILLVVDTITGWCPFLKSNEGERHWKTAFEFVTRVESRSYYYFGLWQGVTCRGLVNFDVVLPVTWGQIWLGQSGTTLSILVTHIIHSFAHTSRPTTYLRHSRVLANESQWPLVACFSEKLIDTHDQGHHTMEDYLRRPLVTYYYQHYQSLFQVEVDQCHRWITLTFCFALFQLGVRIIIYYFSLTRIFT